MNDRDEGAPREADVPNRTLALAIVTTFLIIGAAAVASGDGALEPDIAAIAANASSIQPSGR